MELAMSEKVTSISEHKTKGIKEPRAEMLDDLAATLRDALQTQYRVLIDNDGRSIITEIVAPGVLKPTSKEVVIERDVICKLSDKVTVSDIKHEVFPRWLAEMRRLPELHLSFQEVKPFHFKSAGMAAGYAWQRLPFDPVENAPRPPELSEMMARTSADEANAVEMWIGSLFDYASTRHQYLYIHGVGNDGKSLLKDAVQLMFSQQGIAVMDGDDLTGDKFATSDLEAKRLLVFPDLRKPSLLSSGIFKKITGDDIIGVNPKGLPRHNIKLCAKVLILSNDAPQLEGNRADERRIVSAHFRSFEGGEDSEFKARFLAAAPAIAQYCYSKYCAWRAQNQFKALPQSADALADAMADSTASRAADLAEQLFKVTGPDEAFALAHEVDAIVKGAAGKDYGMLQQLRKWLKACKATKTTNPPRKYKGLQILPAANKFKSEFAD
jgi:hypothetical protein